MLFRIRILIRIITKNSVNGRYTDFGEWSECSAKCGEGKQTRTRTCTNPAPANGGLDCVGEASQTRPCSRGECPGYFFKFVIC